MWLEPYRNKYRAFERYTDPLTDKQKRVSTIIDKDTKASRKAAESVLRDKIAKASTAEKKVTLAELSKAYLAWQKANIKPSSYDSTVTHIGYVVKYLGEDTLVSRLSAKYVSEKLTSKSSTPYMTNRNILYFKAMFNWAFDHDYISDKAYLDKIKRVKATPPRSSVEDYYLERNELQKLTRAMNVKRWKLLTEFLALSGLRIGEAVALLDSDVDTYIHVAKNYNVGAEVMLDSPKTASSRRDVFIQPELEIVIRKVRALRGEVILRTGTKNDFLFMMRNGSMLCYSNYRKYLKDTSLRMLGRSVNPHMLRHTHVCLLAESGVPLETISRRLGHRDSKITNEVYFHTTEKMRKKDNDLLSAIKIL